MKLARPCLMLVPGWAWPSPALEGRQSVGARMPLNAPSLDDIDLTKIRNWIATGAPKGLTCARFSLTPP